MKRQVSLLPLVGIIYFTVSGGAWGMEDIVTGAGPGLALVLLIVTPIVWSLPTSLIVAELAAMLPVEGGYYRWVYFGIGRFWGFQMGWWLWVNSFVDVTILPVLFATNLKFFLPEMAGWKQWLVSLIVIFFAVIINLRGARTVGHNAVLNFIIVSLPFLLLTVLGLAKIKGVPWHPFTVDNGQKLSETFGLGLSVAMWSYAGWGLPGAFAGEMKDPRRTFPLALLIAVPLVMLLYLLPIGAALGASDWREWNSESYPISKVAAQVVGPWLGSFISLVVLASCWSLYNSNLLSISRVPFTMAEDGLLPRWITRTHSKWGTPYASLILCSAIYGLFALLSFRSLVVIDMLLAAVVLLLNFTAVVVLRLKRPNLSRPFKIPGGWLGVWLAGASLTGCLVTCLVFTMISSSGAWKQVAIAAAMLTTGPLAYFVRQKTRKLAGQEEGEEGAAEWIRSFAPASD